MTTSCFRRANGSPIEFFDRLAVDMLTEFDCVCIGEGKIYLSLDPDKIKNVEEKYQLVCLGQQRSTSGRYP